VKLVLNNKFSNLLLLPPDTSEIKSRRVAAPSVLETLGTPETQSGRAVAAGVPVLESVFLDSDPQAEVGNGERATTVPAKKRAASGIVGGGSKRSRKPYSVLMAAEDSESGSDGSESETQSSEGTEEEESSEDTTGSESSGDESSSEEEE